MPTSRANHSEQGIAADWHGQSMRQARAKLPTNCKESPVGISGQLTRNLTIFGKTDYNIAVNQSGHSLGGRIGTRVNW